MGNILSSWKTSLLGLLVLLCGGTNYAQVLPDKYQSLLMLLCGTLTAFGLIVAKDGDKTNAPSPSMTAQKVDG